MRRLRSSNSEKMVLWTELRPETKRLRKLLTNIVRKFSRTRS